MRISFTKERHGWTEVDVWEKAPHIPRIGDTVHLAGYHVGKVVDVIWESADSVEIRVA